MHNKSPDGPFSLDEFHSLHFSLKLFLYKFSILIQTPFVFLYEVLEFRSSLSLDIVKSDFPVTFPCQ